MSKKISVIGSSQRKYDKFINQTITNYTHQRDNLANEGSDEDVFDELLYLDEKINSYKTKLIKKTA